MKIIESKVRKIKIDDIYESHRLDPISIYLEDFEHGKGQITIRCYDKTWSSFWGAMGGTISEFLCRTDNSYLANNFGCTSQSVADEDKSHDYIKKELIRKRQLREVDRHDARDMWEEIQGIEDPKSWAEQNGPLSRLIFSGEWWYLEWPQKPNPDYKYLCRIIDTVKEVLNQIKES